MGTENLSYILFVSELCVIAWAISPLWVDMTVIRDIIKLDTATFVLLDGSYKEMVKDYRIKENNISDLKKATFLKIFQEYIIDYYKNTHWEKLLKNGYPKIM